MAHRHSRQQPIFTRTPLYVSRSSRWAVYPGLMKTMMVYVTTSSVCALKFYFHTPRTNGWIVKDNRPLVPLEYTSPLLHELIGACWCRDPNVRAPFTETVGKLHRLRVIEKNGSDPSIISGDDIPMLSPSLSPLSPASVSPSPRPTCGFTLCFDFRDADGIYALN